MDLGLEQPDSYNALRFLERLAELANGNVGKYFSFSEIWSKARISAVSEEYFKQVILPAIEKKGLVELKDSCQIVITWNIVLPTTRRTE